MANERLQQELADRLERVPAETSDFVMAMLLANVSALLSGMELGKAAETRPN